MKIREINLKDSKIQNIINFESADSAFKDAMYCYNKYELNKNNFDTDYSSVEEAAYYYKSIQYCIQRFTQALEGYFKAIALSTGKTWRDNRQLGHDLFKLYNEIIIMKLFRMI